MIRNGVDWSKVYVNATTDKAVHDAVVALMERKTGFEARVGWDARSNWYPFKMVGRTCLVGARMTSDNRIELSISELAALPDYQPTKRMTVPEICEALGYDVEIVKEK